MNRRRADHAQLSVIWWNDIPSSVIARHGPIKHSVALSPRFEQAIRRAATGGGQAGSTDYVSGWHRIDRPCALDLTGEVDAVVTTLEAEFDDGRLADLVRATRQARRSERHTPDNDHREGAFA